MYVLVRRGVYPRRRETGGENQGADREREVRRHDGRDWRKHAAMADVADAVSIYFYSLTVCPYEHCVFSGESKK